MKASLALIAFTICGSIAAQASQIVNVNALSPSGISLTLSAGTYDVSIIGTSQGGMYNAWDPGTANFGSPFATPATNKWEDSFAIKIDGSTTSYVGSGYPVALSPLGALSLYQSSVLDANGIAPANGALNLATFTLTSTEKVDFTVADCQFADNWGGVSLELSRVAAECATPEPSTLGLMGLVLVGGGVAFRRRLAPLARPIERE